MGRSWVWVVVVLGGCIVEAELPPTCTTAECEDAMASSDGAGWCCPAPEVWSCGCEPTGGFSTHPFACGVTVGARACDVQRSGVERTVDEHGCTTWRVTRPGDTCVAPRDGGPEDAGRPDAGLASCFDRNPRFRGADPSPDGAGWCCRVSAWTCDCSPTGGFTTDPCRCGDTVGVHWCDVAPVDVTASADEHGCDVWLVASTPTDCCNCPDAGAP